MSFGFFGLAFGHLGVKELLGPAGPGAGVDNLILWGDQSGNVLLWGDQSGVILLWGDGG